MFHRRFSSVLAFALSASLVAGCSDDVADVDRSETDAGPDAAQAGDTSGDRVEDAGLDATHDLSEVAAADVPPVDVSATDSDLDGPEADHPDDHAGALPDPLRSRLDELLSAAPRRVDAPGVTAQVVVSDVGSWTGAAGVSSTATGRVTESADRMRIGSVTKTFAAALVLLLVDEGLLSLDSSVDTMLPDLELGLDVTVRSLLSHTSGIYNYTDAPDFIARGSAAATPRSIIEFAEAQGRVHDVGDAMTYSNTGFMILGLLIEALTGQTFAEAVRSRLLEPLGLGDTFVQPDETGYTFADGHNLGRVATALVDMSWAWAAGGMVSNGPDLCRWAEALVRGDLLTESSRAALTTAARLGDGSEVGYGLGVHLTTRGGRSVVGHTGSTLGFRGELFIDPADGTCVAVLTNDFFATPRRLTDDLWQALDDDF